MAEEDLNMPGRRENPRLRLNLPAQLTALAGHESVLLENISATGARVATGLQLRVGVSCMLRVQGLELFGDVAWSRPDRCGLIFEEPLTEQQLLAMRQFDATRPSMRSMQNVWARDFVRGGSDDRS